MKPMHDQAATLRRFLEGDAGDDQRCSGPRARIIAVTSGKGGVGKTNISANLAVALAKLGERVVIVDADLGTADVDHLLGLHPPFHLGHVLTGEKRLSEVVLEGPLGVRIVPGGSGLWELANLGADQRERAVGALAELEVGSDYILIDTGAGVSDNVTRFVTGADEAIVVTTPEPTALADAYALIKVASRQRRDICFHLVVNLARNAAAGDEAARTVSAVAERFLGVRLNHLGNLPADPVVSRAVHRQTLVLLAYPTAPVASALTLIAGRLWSFTPVRRTGPDRTTVWWQAEHMEVTT